MRKHRRKILATHSVIVVTLLASSAVTFNHGSTTVYLEPHGRSELLPGDTARIDIDIDTSTPINALSATITFPPELIEIVGISKEDSFLDLWTEETAIREDLGEIHFSGGTVQKGGLVGSSTALTLTVRAKRPGKAELSFRVAQILASDGRGTAVESVSRPFTYEIQSPVVAGGTSPSNTSAPTVDPDFNADGRVDLVDISILMHKITESYDARYDLNRDGWLGLPDISALFVQMH